MSNKVRKIVIMFIALVAIGVAIAVSVSGMVEAKAKVKAEDRQVVAIVNGNKILKVDVVNAIKSLSVKTEDTERVFPIVLNQMINEKLIDFEIAKSKVSKNPEFKSRLEATKVQLLKTVYLENFLKTKVTDKDVKAEYDKLKSANEGKKEVHARQILVKTEAEAKQVIKDLNKGAKFADLAKERSSDSTAKNGGDVGYFAEGEIIPEFSKAAFALKAGKYTKKPIKTQLGWHVIYTENFRDRKVPALKDMKSSIRTRLGQAAVSKLLEDLRAKSKIEQFDSKGKPLASKK